MRIGLIQSSRSFAHYSSCTDLQDLVLFTISPEHLSFHDIFDSAFATPARYILEIFRRLNNENRPTGGILIFNPLFELLPDVICIVLNSLEKAEFNQNTAVIADLMNRPIAYYLPEWLKASDEQYLTLISAVNAKLDQELLNTIFCDKGLCFTIDKSVTFYPGNGFLYSDELRFIYEYLARRAQALLINATYVNGSSNFPTGHYETLLSNNHALRDGIRFFAIMTHHAGDVLFYSIAAANTPNSHIDGIVVNRNYLNILNRVIPDYSHISVDLVPPYRDGTRIMQSEENHFLEFAPELQPFSFFNFMRPSRDYNDTEFHLIDHFAFALGQSFLSPEELVTKIKGSPSISRLSHGAPFRILLHFDAGWGLKVFPKRAQKELISGLLSAGMEVTVLGTEDRDFETYQSVAFKGLEHLQELFHRHHLLVGSDSFPCHFAVHVAGLPAICLFGPTKPINSDALPSVYYKALERGLSCKPCYRLEDCPVTRDRYCKNMVSSAVIQKEIMLMLGNIYQ